MKTFMCNISYENLRMKRFMCNISYENIHVPTSHMNTFMCNISNENVHVQHLIRKHSCETPHF